MPGTWMPFHFRLYVHVSTAVPLTINVDPLVVGALAVSVMGPPAIMHCAMPVLLMVAIVVFDDIQVRPLETVNIRVVLLLNFPIAVN